MIETNEGKLASIVVRKLVRVEVPPATNGVVRIVLPAASVTARASLSGDRHKVQDYNGTPYRTALNGKISASVSYQAEIDGRAIQLHRNNG